MIDSEKLLGGGVEGWGGAWPHQRLFNSDQKVPTLRPVT